MLDLLIAVLIVAIISLFALFLGFRIGVLTKRWPSVVVLVMVGGLYGLYLLFVRDSVVLVQVLPISSVPVLGDPAPWLASLAGGVLLGTRSVLLARRVVIAALVVAMGWHGPVRVLTVQPPETHNTWNQGVCLQSTFSTCGPAALTTLLKHHGVKTNETALAELCLTSDKGTHLTGLFRGLALKTPEGMKPRAQHMSVDELIANPDRLPAVVSLMLTRELARADPRYAEDWGWDVGVMHTVVVESFDGEAYVYIADPGVGPERWSQRGLRELWTGEVLYLEADD
ncbi:MAG: cysteine peptidase family C39 domain-containing protein [Planctomycetota bacterium]